MSDTEKGPSEPAGADPEAVRKQLARLLFATTRALYRATMMGVPCKAFDELKVQVNLPRPGDWALEVSRFAARDVSPGEDVELEQLGRVIRVVDEDVGRVVFTESFDGTMHRWVNADLVRVFEHPFLEPDDAERLAWVADAEKRHGLPRIVLKVKSL